MANIQMFCSVNDLIEDQQSAGASEARWYEAIRAASDYLQKEIGWFIPVSETRLFNGEGKKYLFIPALLEVTEIINDETTLSADDYLLNPNGRHWSNGPYTWLAVAPEAANLGAWVNKAAGVSIDGLWGLYQRLIATGTTVGSNQNDSAESLIVADGGKISAGMVLKIGNEQELVTGWGEPTANVTALNGAITASDQVITVDEGTLVKRGETIRLDFEQMKVRDIRANQVSVIRAWNGSGASIHVDNTQVDVYRTATVERACNGTSAAAHLSAVAINRYIVPDDVLFLTREIATLMLNKAKSGYQGRTGSAETGVVFYNDAFPKFDIERVKDVYYIPRSM